MERTKFINLRKQLQNDERYRISEEEYYQICSKYNITQEQSQKFMEILDSATVIMKFKQAPKFIFLKPERLSKHMLDILDPEITESQRSIISKKEELKSLKQKKLELDISKKRLDLKGESSATRFMWLLAGGMFIQAGVVARLTWWELSWDVMEPITYILTFSTSIFTFAYFTVLKREYTYEGIWERLARKRKLKLYLKNNFDIKQYESIENRISTLEIDLLSLGDYQLPPHKDLKTITTHPEELIDEDTKRTERDRELGL